MLGHTYYMDAALREAEKAFDAGEVPVGAVLVIESSIVAKGRNQVEQLSDPTAHAEILAISAAASSLGTKRLESAVLYTTLEPCPMCSGAILHARLKQVVFGAMDLKWGCASTLHHLLQDKRFNHQVPVIGGIRESESETLLKSFFQRLRSGETNLN